MKIKQRIVALLSAIGIISLCILTIPVSADIVGDSDYITGWYLTGDMVLYDSGPDLTSSWGGNDPYFDVINATDEYTNLTVGTDTISYPASDYSISGNKATIGFIPGFSGTGNVNMVTGDELTLRLTGSFLDITNGQEEPYLFIYFNESEYYISSYQLEFQYEENNDYTLYQENRDYWNRDYFELDAAWSELMSFVLTLNIKSNSNVPPGSIEVYIEHSIRELDDVNDETSYWAGYTDGLAAGKTQGEATGYRNGFIDGKEEAEVDVNDRVARARQEGYEAGMRAATTNQGSARYTSWLVNAVGGFFNFQIFPGFTLGGILGVIIAISIAIVFLKYYAGG